MSKGPSFQSMPKAPKMLETALDICVHVIVAFHLTERKPLEIPLPVDIIDHDFTDCGLWVFKGFLGLWVLGKDALDIWVMEKYKVHFILD